VKVPQVCEDVDHLVVKLPFRQRRQTQTKQTQTLDRIGCVHRPLERKVHVQGLQHYLRLVHNVSTLGSVQCACGRQELFERYRGSARRRAWSRLTASLGSHYFWHIQVAP
jgi:hypothetical protein